MVLLLVVVVALLVCGALSLGRRGRDRSAHIEDLTSESATVPYDVPPEREPARVVAELRAAGFESVSDPIDPHRLTIMLPLGGEQRDEVRAVLSSGPVRFADEPDQPG